MVEVEEDAPGFCLLDGDEKDLPEKLPWQMACAIFLSKR